MVGSLTMRNVTAKKKKISASELCMRSLMLTSRLLGKHESRAGELAEQVEWLKAPGLLLPQRWERQTPESEHFLPWKFSPLDDLCLLEIVQ